LGIKDLGSLAEDLVAVAQAIKPAAPKNYLFGGNSGYSIRETAYERQAAQAGMREAGKELWKGGAGGFTLKKGG
jgi:hypothetical protein